MGRYESYFVDKDLGLRRLKNPSKIRVSDGWSGRPLPSFSSLHSLFTSVQLTELFWR